MKNQWIHPAAKTSAPARISVLQVDGCENAAATYYGYYEGLDNHLRAEDDLEAVIGQEKSITNIVQLTCNGVIPSLVKSKGVAFPSSRSRRTRTSSPIEHARKMGALAGTKAYVVSDRLICP